MGSGSRYGRKIRANIKKAESTYKIPQKCPHCEKISLKRSFRGVWECTKCKKVMVGGAYEPPTIKSLRRLEF